jgi:hypothetical protein
LVDQTEFVQSGRGVLRVSEEIFGADMSALQVTNALLHNADKTREFMDGFVIVHSAPRINDRYAISDQLAGEGRRSKRNKPAGDLKKLTEHASKGVDMHSQDTARCGLTTLDGNRLVAVRDNKPDCREGIYALSFDNPFDAKMGFSRCGRGN